MASLEISLASETLFHIGSFAVTNSVLTGWVVIVILLILGMLTRAGFRLVPRGLTNAVEVVVLGLYGLVKDIVQNDRVARRLFPLLGVIFAYILVGAWFGLLPGVGSIGFHEMKDGVATFIPLLRSPISDLNTTLALAVVAVVVTTTIGVAVIGPLEYAKKFIRFDSPIGFFVGALESISEFSRIISYSFRLFGNIFAGEVLISVITFLVPWVLPMPFYGFEIFVGLIQALIFPVLVAVFVSLAIQKHEHDDEEHSKPEHPKTLNSEAHGY